MTELIFAFCFDDKTQRETYFEISSIVLRVFNSPDFTGAEDES